MLTSLYLDPPAHGALKALSADTRIPVAVYLREAIDDLLAKHGVEVGSQSERAPARQVKYVAQEIRFWWDSEDKAIHVTAGPGADPKLHTTFKADPKSERWHKSMFSWLSRVLEANEKPGPKVAK